MSPAEWLQLLIDRGPALRNAGVQAISLDGFSVQLAPAGVPVVGPQDETPPPTEYSDPLHRSETYANGIVPGFDMSHINDPDGSEHS